MSNAATDSEMPRIFHGQFLGWSIHQQGGKFIATDPRDVRGVGSKIEAKSLDAIERIISGADLIESATISR